MELECPQCKNNHFKCKRIEESIAIISENRIKGGGLVISTSLPDCKTTIVHTPPYECTECGYTCVQLPIKEVNYE